jgi:hypothetical protein
MATAGPGPSTTAQALLLPGQPIPSSLIKDKPVLGSGCYEQGGKILSSVVGRPRRDGAVSLGPCSRAVESIETPDGRKGQEDGADSRWLVLLERAIWVKHQISDLS